LKQHMSEESFNNGRFMEAVGLFDGLIREDDFQDFLTNRGYDIL
jgi:malate synthase